MRNLLIVESSKVIETSAALPSSISQSSSAVLPRLHAQNLAHRELKGLSLKAPSSDVIRCVLNPIQCIRPRRCVLYLSSGPSQRKARRPRYGGASSLIT